MERRRDMEAPQEGARWTSSNRPELLQSDDSSSDFEVEYSSVWPNGDSERRPLVSEGGGGNSLELQKRGPPDKYRMVWIVFALLGMATLLPWNFFIAVHDYWNFKFRDINHPNSTHMTKLQKEFTPYLAIASNIPNALFVILNVFFGRRFRLNIRLIGALSLMATLFIGVLIMTRIDSDEWQEWFLASTLVIVVFLNICTAIYQGGLIGVAGKFPPSYMGAMMSGQALGGIFPALVNIAVIAGDIAPADIGFYCFLTAFIFVVFSLVAYCAVQTTDFFIFYAGINRLTSGESEQDLVRSSSVRMILRNSWRYQVSVFITFMVSLSVFPSVIVLITSEFSNDKSNVWANTYFTPVACFLLFNCGDYLGRILASWIQSPGPSLCGQNITLALSFSRLLFIPLFMLCNASPGNRNLPVVFTKDADYYALMVLFSVSNGYLGNLCMMHGPKTAQQREDQEKTASLLVAVLVVGIGVGSMLAYPIVSLL